MAKTIQFIKNQIYKNDIFQYKSSRFRYKNNKLLKTREHSDAGILDGLGEFWKRLVGMGAMHGNIRFLADAFPPPHAEVTPTFPPPSSSSPALRAGGSRGRGSRERRSRR